MVAKIMCFTLNGICMALAIIVCTMIASGYTKHLGHENIGDMLLCTLAGSAFGISFYGFYALWRQNVWLIWMYVIVLLVTIFGNCMVLFIVFWNLDEKRITQNVHLLWEVEKESPAFGIMASINEKHQCCGLVGPDDYTAQNLTVPQSCYSKNGKIYNKGCHRAVFEDSTKYRDGINTVMLLTIITQLLTVAYTMMMDYQESRR